MTLTNQNCSHEEFKSRFNLWNIGYQSVQNVSSSSLFTRNITTEIYRIVTFPFVLYGCENWSLNLRKEHRQKVCKNRVLRKTLGTKWDDIPEHLKKSSILRSFTICTPQCVLLEWPNHAGQNVYRRETYTRLWQGNLKERYCLEDRCRQ
jgi:hypothetical protein